MMELELIAKVRPLMDEGHGDRHIARVLGITRWRARVLLEQSRLSVAQTLPPAIVDIEPRTAAEFAMQIASSWRKSVEAIFEVGRLLRTAKDALPHGEFLAMIETSLPFGARAAQMIMKIAADVRLLKANRASLLPPHWATLYQITKLDDDAFQARLNDGTIRPDMERRDLAAIVKRDFRAAREAELAEKIAAGNLALPRERYGVILADPPWRFKPRSSAGLDRAADNHYPTSELDLIKALPVHDIAADDCVLFLWATAPMLPHALEVMAAWGFEYQSQAVWDKAIAGTGYWFRNVHELILVGTRGNIVAPAPGSQPTSIFREKRGRHSVKPEWLHALIERWFPTVPKVELNARRTRSGWDCWGLDAQLLPEMTTSLWAPTTAHCATASVEPGPSFGDDRAPALNGATTAP